MINLSFNDSSLFCTVWSESDDQVLLTQIAHIPLTGDLDNARGNDKVFNAILEHAFKALADEVQLAGQETYVTIPDYWVHHDFTEVDANMGSADSWDFILWQKDQRFGEKGLDYLTYAENIQDNIKHVIHIPTLMISDIKLSISEYGAEPVWLGTESMVFIGLTNRTYGVISEAGNGYDLFIIKRKKLFAGSVRYVKGEWKVSKSFGFKNEIEKLLTIHKDAPRKNLSPVYTLDKLSEKKQAHWKENKIQHINPFTKINIESAESLEGIPYHLLAIQSMLNDEKFCKSDLNLFSATGLIEKIDKQQIQQVEVEQKDLEKKKIKQVEKDEKDKNRKQLNLQYLVVFITVLIFLLSFLMSLYVKNPDIFNIGNQENKINNEEANPSLSAIDDGGDSVYPKQLVDIMQYSSSMMQGIQFVFESFPYDEVSFISVSERDMQLEIVNGEEIVPDLLPLGSMVNYNVQGIACCGGFKHFYDFLLPLQHGEFSVKMDSAISLQNSFSTLEVQVEKLESIDQGKFIQTPYIIKTDSEDKMKAVFEIMLKLNNNISLRKAVFKTNPESGESNSVFYISSFERIG